MWSFLFDTSLYYDILILCILKKSMNYYKKVRTHRFQKKSGIVPINFVIGCLIPYHMVGVYITNTMTLNAGLLVHTNAFVMV